MNSKETRSLDAVVFALDSVTECIRALTDFIEYKNLAEFEAVESLRLEALKGYVI